MPGPSPSYRPAPGVTAERRTSPVTGDAGRLLNGLGRTYVLGIRVATLVPTIAVAILAAVRTPLLPAVLVWSAGAAVWTTAFVLVLRDDAGGWVAPVDAAVLAALALGAPLVVPPAWVATGKSWLLPFLSFACVAMQYYTPPLRGALCSLLVGSGMLAGTLLALPAGGSSASVVTSVWVLVLSALGRILWTLAARAGRIADDIAADTASARRELAVAAAVRSDERSLANALHDTAAATLLMVGLGQVDSNSATLRRRAGRDIEVLRDYGHRPKAAADLVTLLGDAADMVPVDVTLTAPATMSLPAPAAHALAGAASEALNNVVRHSGAARAEVVLRGDARSPRLSVRDGGRGFDAAAARLAGRGLRESVAGRIEAVGGVWRVESAPGRGTVVYLDWDDRG